MILRPAQPGPPRGPPRGPPPGPLPGPPPGPLPGRWNMEAERYLRELSHTKQVDQIDQEEEVNNLPSRHNQRYPGRGGQKKFGR